MRRLCDKDELIALFDAENVGTEIIEDAPTVDAVEVVRCKDCAWYEEGKNHVPYCNNYASLMDHVNDETFCSYGERKSQ